MTTEEKTLLAALTTVAVLVSVAFGAMLDWPVWARLLLMTTLLAVPGLVARNIQRRVQRQRLRQPHIAPPIPLQDQQTQVVDIALPSSVADYDFRFSATTYWRPSETPMTQHANLGGLATEAIITRAQAITAVEQPSKVDIVQHRLASALGAVQQDASGGVEAWADHVQLTLPEADQTRLRTLSNARKDGEAWEHECSHDRRKRAYLSDDVLTSTGSTVVWWLTQRNNDVESTVPLIGALAQLSAAANNTEVPELFRHLVPTKDPLHQPPFEAMDGDQQNANDPFHNGSRQTTGFPGFNFSAGQFTDTRPVTNQVGIMMDTLDLSDEQRALFAHHIAQLIEKFGEPDGADEIRLRFDTPTTDKNSTDSPEPGEDPPNRPEPDMEPPPPEGSWQDSPPSQESNRDGQPQVNGQLWAEPRD